MRRISLLTIAFLFLTASASADVLRSGRHLVKIDAQTLSGDARQYTVTVFDAESRTNLAQMKLSSRGDVAVESETNAGGTHYEVRIEPHGAAYLIHFTADDGGEEGIDSMRGGFTTADPARPLPARPAQAGREIDEPAVLRRVDALYTDDARAAGAVGTVVLEVLIDRGGFVREATVVKPMGYGLSESAVDAVKAWQFAPSMQDRRPVEVLHEVTIEFKP